MNIYKKRNTFIVEEAKKNVKDSIDYCPKCFTESKEEERYPKSVFYKCPKCKYKWGIPLEIKCKKNKKNNNAEIIVRNKQKKQTLKKEKEKTMVIHTDTTETEKFILEAKRKEELLEFDYGPTECKREKLVRPYKIDERNGEKCLLCFCLDDDGIRLYKLDYISNIRIFVE